MAKVVGWSLEVYKQFTCSDCAAIVEYSPIEVITTDRTDEGVPIKGLNCPNCGEFHRTNP